MKTGKLPQALLSDLIAKLPTDPRLLVGPGVGLDAAAIDLGDGRVLVATADPITFATTDIGRYAVHVNANDVACLGAQPTWFLATVLLPEGAEPALAESIVQDIISTCEGMGIGLVGGHTEVASGLDRPIVSGAMLGETSVDRIVRPDRAQDSDHILLTNGIAIEGTALLAREAATALRERGVAEGTIDGAALLLDTPGISIVQHARVARSVASIHALHDPTEGGLSTALMELAHSTGHELRVRVEDVPLFPETRSICSALDLDPMGLLASGALLIIMEASACETVVAALASEGIPGACIGELAGAGSAVIIDRNENPLPRFERDEVARFFDTLGSETAGGATRTSH